MEKVDIIEEKIIHSFSASKGDASVTMNLLQYPQDIYKTINEADRVIRIFEVVLARIKEYRASFTHD